jgi:RNA polymerase subunit RPABC4/transcription elongation factor Spt4
MNRECCPECGHLLSTNRSICPFCDWEEDSDQYSYSLKIENDLSYLDLSQIGQDQLPRF